MRYLALPFTVSLLIGALSAQTCVYVPDASTSGAACNVIPFGDTGTASWLNQKYQMLIPAASIGTVPTLIREIGFVPCGAGVRTFDSLTVKMDHTMAATLSTTFAANLAFNPITVLSVTKYGWQNLANAWTPLGLQAPFMYLPALGNLVIEIEVYGARFPGAAGMVRAATQQRVYAVGWTGAPPATGSSDQAALKVMLCTDLAWASPFGVGCTGSNGLPTLSYTGTPKLNSSPTIDIASAPANGITFLLVGSTNGAPYPIDLGVINMPGCQLYVNSLVNLAVVANAGGAGSYTQVIPNLAFLIGVRLFHQYVLLDPPANGTGVTTSNAGWMLVGT